MPLSLFPAKLYLPKVQGVVPFLLQPDVKRNWVTLISNPILKILVKFLSHAIVSY